jgi:hypothetical protein
MAGIEPAVFHTQNGHFTIKLHPFFFLIKKKRKNAFGKAFYVFYYCFYKLRKHTKDV